MTNNPHIVGAVAGVASGLLLIAANYAGVFAILLFLASPLPIYIAALAWGTRGGISASIMALLLLAVLSSPQSAILIAALITVPALVLGHQANLAQPDQSDPGTMIWYPLDRLLFHLCLSVCIGFIVAGLILGFNVDTLVPELVEHMKELGKNNPQLGVMQDDQLKALAEFYQNIIPFFLPATWVIVHVVNMHLAVKIARSSGRMPRPSDDIPTTTSLPKPALVILPLSLILMMMTQGALSQAASVFAGVFFMAFSLVGLAWLHLKTRINPGLRFSLFASYLLVILFGFPLVVFAIIGLYQVTAQRGPTQSHNSNE